MNKPVINDIWYDDLFSSWNVLDAGDRVVLEGANFGTRDCASGLVVTIGDWQVRAQKIALAGDFVFEGPTPGVEAGAGQPASAVTFPLPAGLASGTNYAVTYKLASACPGVSAGLAWSNTLLTPGPNTRWRLTGNTASGIPELNPALNSGGVSAAAGSPTLAVWTKTPKIKKGAKPTIEFGLRFLQPGRYTLILQQGYPGPRHSVLAGTKVGWRSLSKPFTAPVKTTEVGLKSMIFKVRLAKQLPPGAVLRVVQSQNGAVTSHQVMGW